jgi:hypothetical protein
MKKPINKPVIENLDKEATIFFDIILSLSVLQLPWLILVSILVIALEAIILNRFWGNAKFSFEISLLANLGSALIAVPLLLITEGEGSLWVGLVSATATIAEYRIDQILIFLWGVLFFALVFVVACILSLIPEILIAKTLRAPEERLVRNIILANIASYACIMGTLIGLGLWIGMSPSLDTWEILEDFFVHAIPLNSTLNVLQQITLLLGIILIIILIIWNHNKKAISDETM